MKHTPASNFRPRKSSESNAMSICRSLMQEHGTMKRVAEFLEIDYSHVWKARQRRRVTPTFMQSLVNAGLMQPPEPRRRFACDIPPDCDADKFRAAMRKYIPLAEAESKTWQAVNAHQRFCAGKEGA